MNDKIKEILDFKEDADYKRLSVDEITILRDYITNLQSKIEAYELFDNQKIAKLQEENERLRKELLSKPDNEITLETKDGQILTIIQSERIDMQEKLNKSLEEMYKKYNDYKSRNEKAIEYIRKQTHDEDTGNYLGYPDLIDDEHLLNILQGVDKE